MFRGKTGDDVGVEATGQKLVDVERNARHPGARLACVAHDGRDRVPGRHHTSPARVLFKILRAILPYLTTTDCNDRRLDEGSRSG